MKKNLKIVTACSVLLAGLAFTSCGSSDFSDREEARQNGVGTVQMVNPFVDHKTQEEAEASAGFKITLPKEIPEWVIKTDYRSSIVKTRMIEIIYSGDENYEREIRIRKAITDKKDMSGDYRSYSRERELQINNKTVTARMNEDKIYLVIWKDKGYSYSFRISDGADLETITKYISEIN